MRNIKRIIIGFFVLVGAFWFSIPICRALPPGALLYRTSGDGKMFGYSGDPLVRSEKGILQEISPGHVGIYIGKENGVDYVVEALADGIVKTPADKFVNAAAGEKYLGAKIPKNLSPARQAKAVAIAKNLAEKKLAYDFDFKKQKGYASGEWTCVGLAEKVYESADISNPNNLQALEYDWNHYAVNITPDGLDHYSFTGEDGDCFSRDVEFSKIARRNQILLPAPEIIGFNLGYEKDGERFIFLPYTQFLQPTLSEVKTDINVVSSFEDSEVRGSVNKLSLALRWSLINNPLSSLKIVADKTKDLAINIKNFLFNSSEEEFDNFLEEVLEEVNPPAAALAKAGAVINKADKTATASSPVNFLTSEEEKNANSVKAAIAEGNYYNSSDEPIMALITKALKEGLETSASGASSGVSGSWDETGESEGEQSVGGALENKNLNVNTNIQKIATINRIYSTGNNDYIELYNPTDYDFDLAEGKYRLEKSKTAEDPGLIVRIGNTADGAYPGGTVIKAHDTYLIVSDKASSYFLSQADAIVSRSEFAWPGNGYTIYLGVGAISSSQDPDILEAVGFGPQATYFQGSAPAPEIKDNYVLKRIKSSGNNNQDFALIKSADPSINWEEVNNESISNNTSNNTNINTNITSNNTTSSSSSTTTTNTVINNATSSNATSTDTHQTATTTATSSTEVATSSPEVATSSDDIAETETSVPILINKIYSTGNTDWIELYNPSNKDLDLATLGYRLEKTKTAQDPALMMRIGSSSDGLYPGGMIIKALGTYLIVSDDASNYYQSQADAIATRTEFSWFNHGYTFYLGRDAISSSTDPDIIDYVGIGTDATYWQGNAPAPGIIDNYILSRLATTSHNNLDFSLIRSTEPGIDWGDEPLVQSSSNSIYTFSEESYDIFPRPETITSPGIKYLWHFDDCYGNSAISSISSTSLTATGNWLPGKFACAKHNGYVQGKVSAVLEEAIDLNNFSLSFWFKQTTDYPRLSLTLADDEDNLVNLTLENGLIQVEGLATPNWRTYLDFPFDHEWRQVTLVVNRDEGYWGIYLDGELKYLVNTYKLLSEFSYLEIGGNNWDYGLDELAIWDRSLSEEEIVYLRESEKPFAPLKIPPPQEKAVLKHFWNFNEAIGTTSKDLITGLDFALSNHNWFSTSLTNSYLLSAYGESFSVPLPTIEAPDLSVTMRWRVPDITNDNRFRLSLKDVSGLNAFSLITSIFNPRYYLNGGQGYFNYVPDIAMPRDTDWHDIALVYDSYRYQLSYYIDGILTGTAEYIWPGPAPLINYLEIYPENWATEIDDLGLWAGALSPRQVQEISANN